MNSLTRRTFLVFAPLLPWCIAAVAQSVGVSAAAVALAQARLTRSRAALEREWAQTGRVFELDAPGGWCP